MERHRRRSSLFGLRPETSKTAFPKDDEELNYPQSYLDKLIGEIAQFQNFKDQEVVQNLEKHAKKIKELKSKTYDEQVLSEEQKMFIKSAEDCFREYIRTAEELPLNLHISGKIYDVASEDMWSLLARSSENQEKLKLLISKNVHF